MTTNDEYDALKSNRNISAVPQSDKATPPTASSSEDASGPSDESHHDTSASNTAPTHPLTLAVDVGGTGLKASVLDRDGRMVADRVRMDTPYPLPPEHFCDVLVQLVKPLPTYDRVSIGFPGVVRGGVILTAPHFVTVAGPGAKTDPKLLSQWTRFDAASVLVDRLGKPVRIANDADLQGLAVVKGNGLEFVVTLGTGVGTALFQEGHLAPHLELAHHEFRKGETYNDQIGDAAYKQIGMKRWRKRVLKALCNFEALINYDKCYVGGGNARHLVDRLPDHYVIVNNVAGILGGIKLWDDKHASV